VFLVFSVAYRGGDSSVARVVPAIGRQQSRRRAVQVDASVQSQSAAHGACQELSSHSS